MAEKNEEILEEVLEELEKESAEKAEAAENEAAAQEDTAAAEDEAAAQEDTVAADEAAENEAAETGAETEASEADDETDGAEGEAADTNAGDSKTSNPSEEKKGFFKKKKDKRDEQIEELNDKLRRQMAEFDNFRKRTEKEKSQMYDMGAKTVIEKILPVIDNFERGLAAVPEDKKEDAFVVGMDKVYRQMLTELEAAGVKPIEAVGKEFDPGFHNAVMQVESQEYESGVVAQELLKGYMYKDSVVRHSMVAVVP